MTVEGIERWEAGPAEELLRGLLDTFPCIRLRVTGTCMTPDLYPGDTVVVSSVGRRPAKWGDIVLVRHRDGLRLHRLVWRWPFASDRFRWLTKADRSAVCDPRVSPTNLLGTVVRVESAALAPRFGNVWFRKTIRSLLTGLIGWARARLVSQRAAV